jgi:hypothetical protein
MHYYITEGVMLNINYLHNYKIKVLSKKKERSQSNILHLKVKATLGHILTFAFLVVLTQCWNNLLVCI